MSSNTVGKVLTHFPRGSIVLPREGLRRAGQHAMAPENTITLVSRLVAEICEIDQKTVRSESKLVGLGLDSVRVLDLLMAVEDALDIELSENDPALADVQTVADLAALIEKRRS